MSYEGFEKSQQPREQARQAVQSAGPAVAPGKRTRTMRLPPGPAGAPPPVQHKPDPTIDPRGTPTADAARQEQAALTAQWIDTTVRPDLHPPPVQRAAANRTAQPARTVHPPAAQSKGVVQRRSATDVVQLDLRDTARAQHEARGEDTPAGGSGGQHGSFLDMEEDDAGPEIHHDHGHLDDGNGNLDESLREDPTWRDRMERLKWIAKLEAAELLRPDLVDGTSAYRHFLFGNGATRDIEYGRFLENDSSGQTVLASALEDTRQAAIERHDQDLAGSEPSEGTQTYHIRTDTMSVTSGDARYPYPATENWQKAIGAHSIWIESTVTVTVTRIRDPSAERPAGNPEEGEMSSIESGPPSFTRSFDVEMTIHAEDMYNFNPGDADIATGTPDAANGRFEITGLGHEYLNRGTFTQSFEFEATMDPAESPEHSASPNDPGRASRSGRPADRRAYPTTR